MFTEFSGCGLSSNQHTWITPNSIVTSLREIGEDFNISDKNMTVDQFFWHPIFNGYFDSWKNWSFVAQKSCDGRSLSYLITLRKQIREAFIKKNILLLTFVNKDFTPPPNYWQKTIEVRGSGQGGDPPPFIKVKNNIV